MVGLPAHRCRGQHLLELGRSVAEGPKQCPSGKGGQYLKPEVTAGLAEPVA